MRPVGGFFELELPHAGKSYHEHAIALSTGRACLRVIIRSAGIKRCYVPFYTCDTVYAPFYSEYVNMATYAINDQLEPSSLPELSTGEFFLYINYFGIKSKTVEVLRKRYGSRLIIDNTHAFFHRGYADNYSFTSARKHFGVPDGAYAYGDIDRNFQPQRFAGADASANILRLHGRQEEAYKAYTDYEKTLNDDIYAISVLSEKLLSQVDYSHAMEARKKNFRFLHEHLEKMNQLLIDSNDEEVPFMYPLLPARTLDKKEFHQASLFIPSLWNDPCNRNEDGFAIEKDLATRLFPIPIDHRYTTNDLWTIIQKINEQAQASI